MKLSCKENQMKLLRLYKKGLVSVLFYRNITLKKTQPLGNVEIQKRRWHHTSISCWSTSTDKHNSMLEMPIMKPKQTNVRPILPGRKKTKAECVGGSVFAPLLRWKEIHLPPLSSKLAPPGFSLHRSVFFSFHYPPCEGHAVGHRWQLGSFQDSQPQDSDLLCVALFAGLKLQPSEERHLLWTSASVWQTCAWFYR